MEGKKPMNSIMQAEAEARFAQEVSQTIANDPLSVTRPLKYGPGAHVWIAGIGTVTVQKCDVGIYLVHSKDGMPMVYTEQSIKPIN